VGAIGLVSQFVSSRYGGPVMLYAILFGIAYNFLNDKPRFAAGIQFSATRVLQLGVILLGAAVTISEIANLGWPTALLVITGVTATIVFGWVIGRLGGLTSPHAFLSAGAVAICGASAAMAISSVLPPTKDNERNLVLTVVGVTTLSTIAMIIYPSWTHFLELSDNGAGVFLGATIHDVAQVLGAGYIISDDAGAIAAVVKLMRVTLLAPAVFIIAMIFASRGADSGATRRAFPVFLIGFAIIMIANSVGAIPETVRDFLKDASRWCLIVAVSALGVKTSLKDVFTVGPAPFAVLVAQTLFLAGFVTAAIMIFSTALPN